MPILDKKDIELELLGPGVERHAIVDGTQGADSLSVGDVKIEPGSKAPTHFHPTEEAMVILEGELEAVLGDEVITVTEGQNSAGAGGRQARVQQPVGSAGAGHGHLPDGEDRADAGGRLAPFRGPPLPQWERIEVRAKEESLTCTTRRGGCNGPG